MTDQEIQELNEQFPEVRYIPLQGAFLLVSRGDLIRYIDNLTPVNKDLQKYVEELKPEDASILAEFRNLLSPIMNYFEIDASVTKEQVKQEFLEKEKEIILKIIPRLKTLLGDK